MIFDKKIVKKYKKIKTQYVCISLSSCVKPAILIFR